MRRCPTSGGNYADHYRTAGSEVQSTTIRHNVRKCPAAGNAPRLLSMITILILFYESSLWIGPRMGVQAMPTGTLRPKRLSDDQPFPDVFSLDGATEDQDTYYLDPNFKQKIRQDALDLFENERKVNDIVRQLVKYHFVHGTPRAS
ncbi:uncharacterized protein DEA37_0005743 [Paragonimus westermani]|uniref:Uncharacterized protein n=1 Tax=Paragonimus westermani TaxID=34504 RepID=A0A5J4NU90_9TREM|nr:uncharacterized protein DEA37_0005743 [Paragonimus westermani]